MKRTFLLCCLSASLLMACEREEQPAPEEHAARTVDLRLAFVFTHGTHGYELASEYEDAAGHLYKLDRIRFLLSGLHVVDDYNNLLADYPDLRILVDAEAASNDFALGTLTASHAHQIRFHLGLPPGLNHADPATASAPLDNTAMHWGMAPDEGYWFLVMEGRVDSNGSGSIDEGDAPFSYKCGTDALIRTGWALMHVEIPDGGTLRIEVPVDVERLMGNVDVTDPATAWGAGALNVQLMDSLSANFHEAH
ncbi:MAG TPA: MbnP family protein [Flavobacteriales bacterium]